MIRHVIVFNAIVAHTAVLEMAEQGKQELGAIPGVTDVRFGVTVDERSRYRYLFDIGFVDAAALERYRTHPAHIRFADTEFRPIAPDRITTDFQLM